MINCENERVLVIAPHCDDELLMAGGLLQKAGESGIVFYGCR